MNPLAQAEKIDPMTGLPMQQPVFPPTAQQAGQAMFGTQQPGSYDRVMPLSPLGKIDPTKKGHSSVKSLTAQKKYNDQLRKQQADKAPKKAYTKTSRKIEKVPRKKVKAVSAIKPAGIQTSATKPTASVEIKNK